MRKTYDKKEKMLFKNKFVITKEIMKLFYACLMFC